MVRRIREFRQSAIDVNLTKGDVPDCQSESGTHQRRVGYTSKAQIERGNANVKGVLDTGLGWNMEVRLADRFFIHDKFRCVRLLTDIN